jgi:nucleotide-binding universal stress UspA family protein
MLRLDSIVCSVDFSEQSGQALRWAAALASGHDARLTVVTAVEPLLANAAKVRLGVDLVRTETEPALREFVEGVLPRAGGEGPALVARAGEPDDVILDTAARADADLIVMGTQGLGGIRKLLLGSTAERVLRRTRVAVLAVPHGAAGPLARGSEGARLGLERILSATDFSPTSVAALEWAAALADAARVPLLVAHVVAPVAVAPQWRPYVEQADEERVAAARAELDKLLARLPAGPARETAVALGRPADEIASMAERRQAGLVVMGLTGGRDAESTRPGSIAYRVLTLSRVPVLVVPAAAAT